MTGSVKIIDETRGTYTNPDGKIEFVERDTQQRVWKGFWIRPPGSGANVCSSERGGSDRWGDYVFRFDEAYNRYTGYWDYCGQGQRFPTEGRRKRS